LPTIGAVIVARQPRNRIGWLCCAVGFLVGQAFAWYALVHRPGRLPGGPAMGWLGNWPWFIALVLILVFLLLLFPDGRLVSRRWRPVAWMTVAWLVLVWVGAAFAPGPLDGTGIETVPNPVGVEGAEAAFELLDAVVTPGFGLLILLAVASMVVRFRRAWGVERQQLKWFTYAALLSTLLFLVFTLTGLDARSPSVLAYVIAAVWLTGIPLAIGVALLRYHLFDIDRLINHTLVYGLLTALLGAVYAGAVLLLGHRRPASELGGGRCHPGRGGAGPAGPAPHPGRRGPALQPPPLRRGQDRGGVQRPPAGPGRPRHALG
jgi:hypothetical protein